MIDWSKVGIAGAPSPNAGTTTAPVAPASPGSIAAPTTPSADGMPPIAMPGGEQKPSDPLAGLGASLFGQGNGSLLGGVPVLGDLGRAAGPAAAKAWEINPINMTVVKPVEAVATGLSHIPLGWLPGGADETFNQIGEQLKANQNDPYYYAMYQQWQQVNAVANADVLGGGNMKGDFNGQFMKAQDDRQKSSLLGTTPDFMIARSETGSVGGALSLAVQTFLGLTANTTQRALGGAGIFDPGTSSATYEQQKERFANGAAGTFGIGDEARKAFEMLKAGQITEDQARAIVERASKGGRNRVQEAADRMDLGLEVSDVEKQAVEAWRSGAWTEDHAQDYLVTHGSSITRNPVGQIAGSVVFDPLTWATIGAGSVAKAGKVGMALKEAGVVGVDGVNASAYERAAMAIHTVQQSPLGPAFRIARGLIDPLAVYKPGPATAAVNDMVHAISLNSFSRAYGAGTVNRVRAIARQFGLTHEVDSAIASYSVDQANLMMSRMAVKNALDQGLGEEFVHTQIDDVIRPLVENAPRDSETMLTDQMQQLAHNTFTAEEDATLAGRMAATFGQDVPYWEKTLAKEPFEVRSALHALTYKRAETEYMSALGAVDHAAYDGELPLKNMVLTTPDTLDNVVAEDLSTQIKTILASDAPDKIEQATRLWNEQSLRFPRLANYGYAPGGEEQLKALVKELDRDVERGAITRRAMEGELAHGALKPINDFLDRNSMPITNAAERDQAKAAVAKRIAKDEARRSTLEDALNATLTKSGKAKKGMKVARDEARAALDNFNRMHPKANLDEALTKAGNKRLWNIGFRPDEEVAWGLKRDLSTGLYIVDRDPTISHVVDAVPGRQPFSDTTRNFLGQALGKSTAERLNKPVDSIEAFLNTQRDMVTGRRLVQNVQMRFERSTFDAGIPKPISREIMQRVTDMAGLDRTTIKGLSPQNVWKGVADIIPRDLVLKDGTYLNEHVLFDHLLRASEGDMRIVGATSKFSQRVRTWLHAHGDAANMSGQLTVTQYNKMRYAFNPMFLIQRIGDAPYYSALYGVMPVGKSLVTEQTKELEALVENMARSQTARWFSMDMTEFATRTNFTAGIKSAIQQAGVKASRLDKIIRAPDAVISANMTNMLYARMGDIVQGALDDLAKAAEKDPELASEMLAQADELKKSFGEWRAVYSEQAGRTLDDNETGLRYVQDILQSWRRHVVNADGTLDFQKLLHEGERAMPSDIADIGPLRPDAVAQELGYSDALSLRKDIAGTVQKINGQFQVVKGENDLASIVEKLRTKVGAHPDYVKRFEAYFGSTWDDFWYKLSKPLAEGGLDISPHYAKEAQDLIAGIAKDRGMDPWEYLSGVMATNIGPKDLNTEMGRLVAFLKGGPLNGSAEDWGAFFRSHLDPSAQQTLVDEWGRMSGKGAALADVPDGFTRNPHVAASGQTFPMDVKRDGLYHVTTARDAVMKEGFRPSAAGEGAQGFGSAGDTINQGRVSFLTDQARAQTYMDRMKLAVGAARGDVTLQQIKDYFRPLYEKAYPGQAEQIMSNAAGAIAIEKASTPQELYGVVRNLDGALTGGSLTSAEKAVNLTAKFESVSKIDPNQIAMLNLATRERAQVQKGIDLAELTIKPEDVVALGAKEADTADFFDKHIEDMLKHRVANGPFANADVESAIQQVSKLTQATLKDTPAEGMTRHQLRDLVNAVPTNQAAPFNRSQFLIVNLLKAKIDDAQRDIFRLAEMQTSRSVLERSLNHPLFGLYPASYMWGKVLPETVKFLARNPYAATYVIADVQRAIATQREYDPDFERMMASLDRSAFSFLLDYLTPSLPWSDHSARMSPMVRDLFKGKDPWTITKDEFATMSPERWAKQFVNVVGEAPGAFETVTGQDQSGAAIPKWATDLQNATGGAAPTATGGSPTITGAVPASGLQPILNEDLKRLERILIRGEKPTE